MPQITIFTREEIEQFCRKDLQVPFGQSFAHQEILASIDRNGWFKKQTNKSILAEFLHQNFLLGMGGMSTSNNYMVLETGFGFRAEIDGLEKIDPIYNYFKRFLFVRKNNRFDRVIENASYSLDLFKKINQIEAEIFEHQKWMLSMTRDFQISGMSKKLRKVSQVNTIEDADRKVPLLRWSWEDMVHSYTNFFKWDEKIIARLNELGDVEVNRDVIKNKFALRRMAEHKKERHLFGI